MTNGGYQRGAFNTADAEEFSGFLERRVRRAYAQVPAGAGPLALGMSWTATGPFMVRHCRLGDSSVVDMDVEAPEAFHIVHTARGQMRINTGGSRIELGDRPHLLPTAPYTSTMAGTDLVITALARPWVESFAAELLDTDSFCLRFHHGAPLPRNAEDCVRAVKHLHREVLGDDEAMSVPLIRAEAARAAATTLLWSFPGTFLDHTSTHEPGPVSLGPIRRAVGFIEEHLGEPVGVVEIAAAARLSPHGLVVAFRRQLGTTPRAYLQTRRLEAAHHDLLEASPVDGATVAAIAHRWGFADQQRFTAEYRAHYGCSPTTTLLNT